MKYHLPLALAAVLTLGLLPGGALSQQRSLKDQLVGTWSLIAFNSIDANGGKKPVFGTQPRGILMIDGGGHYAMVLTDPGRPKWKTEVRTQVTNEDLGMAARGLVAQFGVWSVDDGSETLTRKVEGALSPNLTDGEEKVSVALSGDELTTTMELSGATGGKAEWVFRRVK